MELSIIRIGNSKGIRLNKSILKRYNIQDKVEVILEKGRIILKPVPHPSTIICPITTHVITKAEVLRVHLETGMANLRQDCDVMIDQIRAIDNKRLIKRIGELPSHKIQKIKDNIRICLDLDYP